MNKVKLYFKSGENYNIDFQGSTMIISQGSENSAVPFSLGIGNQSNMIVEGETVEAISLGAIQISNSELSMDCGFNVNYIVEFVEDDTGEHLRIGKTFVDDVTKDLANIPYLNLNTLKCFGSPDFISMKITKNELEVSDSECLPPSSEKHEVKKKFIFRIESEECLKLAFCKTPT